MHSLLEGLVRIKLHTGAFFPYTLSPISRFSSNSLPSKLSEFGRLPNMPTPQSAYIPLNNFVAPGSDADASQPGDPDSTANTQTAASRNSMEDRDYLGSDHRGSQGSIKSMVNSLGACLSDLWASRPTLTWRDYKIALKTIGIVGVVSTFI